MNRKATIRALLATANQPEIADPAAIERVARRAMWAGKTIAMMREAQHKVTDAWDRIFAALPDDLSEEEVERLPEPPEQAELDALEAEIMAVNHHDRWPKHLHWTL